MCRMRYFYITTLFCMTFVLICLKSFLYHHGPLTRYVKRRVFMRRERFPRHRRLAIPTYITAHAWRTCRNACRDRQLAVSFEVGGGENVPGIHGACRTRNFTYLVRGPYRSGFFSHVLLNCFTVTRPIHSYWTSVRPLFTSNTPT